MFSTEHEWFRRAQAGEREYWDYFYLRLGRVQSDGTVVPPTNWESKFGGSAWAPFTDTAGEVYRDKSGGAAGTICTFTTSHRLI